MMFNGMNFPRQDFGMRHQSVFDREAMAGMGGGMARRQNTHPGVRLNGMFTGGPGQSFQAPSFQTGGNLPPMQQGLPPMSTQAPPSMGGWMAGGPGQSGYSPLMSLWAQYMGNRRFG